MINRMWQKRHCKLKNRHLKGPYTSELERLKSIVAEHQQRVQKARIQGQVWLTWVS